MSESCIIKTSAKVCHLVGRPFAHKKAGDFVNVVVVGGGAVGMLTASFLAEAGIHVTVAVRRQEQAQELNRTGLTRVNLDGTKTQSQVEAITSLNMLPPQNLAVIAVKYGQLHTLYKELSALPKDVPLLFMQNGLAHYEEALQLPQQTIAFSSVSFGAQVKNNTTVLHRGPGLCKIAPARGNHTFFLKLQQMVGPYFPVTLAQNAEQMLFEKAVFNCLINPLTTVLQIKNGELLTNKQAFLLMQTIYKELIDAFSGLEVTVPFSDVITLCEKTAENTSSMLADRLNGQKSEIDTIVGAILKKALINGYTLPTLRTFYHQILAIEESGELN
ncbi:ketopantoate reductase family protein [Lysinibacillus sp. NPDC096418]|uniref:ketopantoate reductase family protein n=1 Tax=Lysinibacillus sp. NPDC096418 TaxID=3364138 RepID=UPI003817D656